MFEYLKPKDGPVFTGLEQEEVVYAKDQPQYIPLRTLRGNGEYQPVLSRWTLTTEQRKAIADGADIILEISTFGGPLQPIRMSVATDDLDANWVRACLLGQQAKNVKSEVA